MQQNEEQPPKQTKKTADNNANIPARYTQHHSHDTKRRSNRRKPNRKIEWKKAHTDADHKHQLQNVADRKRDHRRSHS